MRRRAFLTVAGAGVVAGCGSILGRSGFDSRFDGEPCASEFGDETTCYHAVASPGQTLVLAPARERLPSPDEAVRFTLTNDLPRTVDIVLTFPDLLRRVDGTWYRIPGGRQDQFGTAELPPGDSLTFGLSHSGRALDDPAMELEKPYGAGEFAYRVRTTSPDPKRALARVRIDGDPMTLSPPENVELDQSGERLTVRRTRDSGNGPPLTLRATARPDVSSPTGVPAEAFHGRWELRAAAYLGREGVSEVVVESVDDDFFRTPGEWLDAAGVPWNSEVLALAGLSPFELEQQTG